MATITIGIMDPPYESANTPTAFRLVDAAIRKGHNVNVFCYEGATAACASMSAAWKTRSRASAAARQWTPGNTAKALTASS
jgi:sulfur relay (sulfurtransferase) complex TusBCD TusD component (DsrE family)